MKQLVPGTILLAATLLAASLLAAWPAYAEKRDAHVIDKFRQLGTELRDPNVYRTASGSPGPQYWQQRADYNIKARLDEKARRIEASETIVYTNGSPDTLRFLWVQLDQNRFRRDSLQQRSQTGAKAEDGISDQLSFGELRKHQSLKDNDYGFVLNKVADGQSRDLPYVVVDTMMRIDLPSPLRPGGKQTLRIDWAFNITDEAAVGSRGGYEHFEENDTYIYFLAQWFPRMAAYTDYTSWQHHQFLGRGEFALEFGDYDVELTVPADHVVSATGELTNPRDVLSAAQRERLDRARSSSKPVYIVTPDEALENEKAGTDDTRTWRFSAQNVRDFAWASSRKFVWDAAIHKQDGTPGEVLAMSFFPNEADPIWSQYSTEAVIHTMDVYSRFSFPYPYPTAQSVNTWLAGGMEYPMITFNGYRPEPIDDDDKDSLVEDLPPSTYKRSTKHRLIGVIIHEIGHIYFPMTVNSDERQWTWMDEGINSFLEHLAEVEWEENFHDYAEKVSILDRIGPYMISENQVPVMSQSDSILQFGPNAYTKPAAALLVLRETVMGRELFDFAFKEYARRWRFKRPTPEDFFRTMEDASAVDLDWFWRGWFYTTDHVDVDLSSIREYRVSSMDPRIENEARRELDALLTREPIEQARNREEGRKTRLDRVEGLEDFYNENDKYTVSNQALKSYVDYLEGLEPWERRTRERAVADAEYVYFVDFENKGGLLSALPLKLTFADGSEEEYMVPAEVWRRNGEKVTKLFVFPKQLSAIELDPHHQTADVDRANNYYPRRIFPSRLELFKYENEDRDLMLEMLEELKDDDKEVLSGKPVPLTR